jgi:arsenate reductase (thioredoxin)
MPPPFRVLFICTGNCCRSQMAEALLRHLGGERFVALSAGSQPAGFVHPLAIQAMRHMGISTDGQYSKSFDDFAGQPLDITITVCDNAAAEVCPRLPGGAPTAHWGLPDPSFAPGTAEDRLQAALVVARQARSWIERLIALPLEAITPEQRQEAIRAIAEK